MLNLPLLTKYTKGHTITGVEFDNHQLVVKMMGVEGDRDNDGYKIRITGDFLVFGECGNNVWRDNLGDSSNFPIPPTTPPSKKSVAIVFEFSGRRRR